MSWTPPSPDDLQRELERVRAAQPEAASAGPATPSVRQYLTKSVLRFVLLWLLLVVSFLAIWHFLN